MNSNIKQLSEQSLASTKWSIVNDLSTELVCRNTEMEIFANLLLADCLKLCRENIDTQNKRFAPILHSFVGSFEKLIKEKYGYDKF
jgi:hypothetical protein